MNFKEKLTWLPGNLEEGMYQEAGRDGKTFSMWLEDHKAKSGAETPYFGMTQLEVETLRKQMKKANQPIPATAFEEALMVADIKAFGQRTDYVGKFFQNAASTTLMPEYIANRVYAGMIKESLVPRLIADDQTITTNDFKKVYISDADRQRQLQNVAKATEFPETTITVADRSTKLSKFGRYLNVAYEDIDMVPLSMFNVALERIGMQIGVDETDAAIDVAVNGDGNSNSASTYNPTTSGSLVTTDVITLATKLPTPYKANILVGRKAQLVSYYGVLADFDNPTATWGFMGIMLPEVHEWDRSVLTSDYLLILDNRFALGRVSTGSVMTESENIIRKQIKGTAVSYRSAFHKIDNDAFYVLDVTA